MMEKVDFSISARTRSSRVAPLARFGSRNILRVIQHVFGSYQDTLSSKFMVTYGDLLHV